MTNQNKLRERLQSRIARLSDTKTKLWWENYVKHGTTFRGVGIPKIRQELKEWYKEERIDKLSLDKQLSLALSFFAEEYAEDKLAGVLFLQIYLYDKCDDKALLSRLEAIFAKGYIYDWNVCDWLCVRVLGPIIKENGMSCAKAISQWHTAKNVWQARCSVVAFANLTMETEFVPLLVKSCAALIKREERFAKTAVGWVLRELSRTDKRSVVDFINKNRGYFSRESLRNATKYFSVKEKEKFRKTSRDKQRV